MVTGVDRWRGRIARLGERYGRWESRRTQRFAGWSVRRRWVLFVLVPLLVLCCGGAVVGVPLAWVTGLTVEAGRGAVSPDAAANEYLMALSFDNEDGLLPLLDDEHEDELLEQWRGYRDAMKGTDPPPFRLSFGALTVGPTTASTASVTTNVRATWFGTGGWSEGYTSEALPWRFETREDNGWRVSRVEAPAWCGGYVLASKCR